MFKRKKLFCYVSASLLLLSLLLSSCSKPAEPAEVTAIYAGTNHTIGLKADGTVAALGLVPKKYVSLSDWTNIVHVSASDNHVVGVKADGTVVAAGENSHGQCDVSGWTNVVAVATAPTHTLGLRSDGTVLSTGRLEFMMEKIDTSSWSNIAAIATSESNALGLKADGTVVSAGVNNFGQCDVSGYSDVTAVAAGSLCSILLHADGSLTALGNYNSSADLSGTDFVSIHACHQNDLALCSDGTFKNLCFSSHVPDESEWKDLIFITGGNTHTIGIQKDGTILVKGANTYGECDIENWKYVGPRP